MFKRIFGKSDSSLTPAPRLETVCLHTVLVPAWDSVEDMGKDQKVTRFTCESCHQEFSALEGRALRNPEAGRLNEELTGGTEQTPTN